MSGHWKLIAAVPFAVLAACSSHKGAYDSASSAGAVAPDSAMRDTTTTPAMAPTPIDTTAAMPVDTTLKDTTTMDSTKKSTRRSKRPSKKK